MVTELQNSRGRRDQCICIANALALLLRYLVFPDENLKWER